MCVYPFCCWCCSSSRSSREWEKKSEKNKIQTNSQHSTKQTMLEDVNGGESKCYSSVGPLCLLVVCALLLRSLRLRNGTETRIDWVSGESKKNGNISFSTGKENAKKRIEKYPQSDNNWITRVIVAFNNHSVFFFSYLRQSQSSRLLWWLGVATN